MENGFDLLEQKVKKAAETVKHLRHENKELEDQATKTKAKLQEAEKKLRALEQERAQSGERIQEVEGLQKELKGLQREREEIKTRVSKLVDLLETLE